MKEVLPQHPEFQETTGVVDMLQNRISRFLGREELFGDTAQAISDMWTEAMKLHSENSKKRQFTENHPTMTALGIQGVAGVVRAADYVPAVLHLGVAVGGWKASNNLWDASIRRFENASTYSSSDKIKASAQILMGVTDRLLSTAGYGVSVLNGYFGLQKRHDRDASIGLEIAARVLEQKYKQMNENNTNIQMHTNDTGPQSQSESFGRQANNRRINSIKN